jgi:hypothetical protein
VEKVNEYFDKNYTCAGWRDVFAKEEEEVRVPTGGILDMDFGSGDDEDDEDVVSADESDDEEDDASDVVSRCSGDEALGVKVPEDKIDVRNILEGPRKKRRGLLCIITKTAAAVRRRGQWWERRGGGGSDW